MSFLVLPSKPSLHLQSPNLSPSVPQNNSGVVLSRLFTGHSFLSFLPFSMWPTWVTGFPDDSDGKEFTYSTRDLGLIPRSGRSPGEGHGNPLQYSCLENSMERGAWWATVHGVAKTQTRLSDSHTHTHTHTHLLLIGFPGGGDTGKESCQCRRRKRPSFDLWVGKIPWRRK